MLWRHPKTINMKKIILTFLTCWTLTAFGQKLDFSLSAGTGKTYIFESIDKGVNVNYSLPLSLMTEMKFTPKDKTWGVKLRMHHIQSSVTGENWEDKTPLNGYVNALTTSLLLENEITRKKYSSGFNFGLGITKEIIQPLQYNSYDKSSTSYATITIGGHFSYKMSQDFDFQIQPAILWQDPFKTIGVVTGNRFANFAGEDLSAVVNFGIRYRFMR
jgi:hypothetical protein